MMPMLPIDAAYIAGWLGIILTGDRPGRAYDVGSDVSLSVRAPANEIGMVIAP
jgi:hypothetical protein